MFFYPWWADERADNGHGRSGHENVDQKKMEGIRRVFAKLMMGRARRTTTSIITIAMKTIETAVAARVKAIRLRGGRWVG